MSKASKLGTGASFAQTQPVSARRQAINAATNAPTDGAPPPVTLPLSLISLNPSNPRTELGDLSQLAGSLRDHGQKQAISIMSRFSYLEANPGKEDELEAGTKYVAIDGNSRLAAAREAGLADINVTLNEDLGSNPDEVLESALVANIHRRDLDPLDEARALQQLLSVHGTQEALAARLHRSQGWVSQRLALLGLTPELQEKLASGEEPADLLRRVGNKKPEEQEAHLERLKSERQRKAAAPPLAAPSAPAPTAQNGAETPPGPLSPPASAAQSDGQAAPSTRHGVHYGVMTEVATGEEAAPAPVAADEPEAVHVPEPRPEPLTKPQIKMPWDDGGAAMEIAFDKLTRSGQRQAALSRYVELVGGPEAFVEDLRAGTSREFRQQLSELLGE
ncbi:ParB/RepB/Spo0J family partition protein [Streptomyces zhihengii]|uniref:ParB/RepB/Spo0J family partition protein n=1 Tax=Streptomyces zhihengii TaxID=1818004 RepID=A0ABS2V441_9ACTN|nr:ParB/RepB/Spo0J family partition protein [Streptomyces zhihengii]MBM9624473.1 ParB/RepB/Spo0J family partition protein [Streptomyces zhihengii]